MRLIGNIRTRLTCSSQNSQNYCGENSNVKFVLFRRRNKNWHVKLAPCEENEINWKRVSSFLNVIIFISIPHALQLVFSLIFQHVPILRWFGAAELLLLLLLLNHVKIAFSVHFSTPFPLKALSFKENRIEFHQDRQGWSKYLEGIKFWKYLH